MVEFAPALVAVTASLASVMLGAEVVVNAMRTHEVPMRMAAELRRQVARLA